MKFYIYGFQGSPNLILKSKVFNSIIQDDGKPKYFNNKISSDFLWFRRALKLILKLKTLRSEIQFGVLIFQILDANSPKYYNFKISNFRDISYLRFQLSLNLILKQRNSMLESKMTAARSKKF